MASELKSGGVEEEEEVTIRGGGWSN